MVKDSFVITFTNAKGAHHFRFRQYWVWLFPLLLALTLLGLGLTSQFATDYYVALEESRENALLLNQSLNALEEKNTFMLDQLEQDKQQIETFNSALKQLQALAGYESNPDLAWNQEIEATALSMQQRRLAMTLIPSGSPMDYRYISSSYGNRKHPITKKRHSHVGIDLRANKGTKVRATANGFVFFTRKNFNKGYGNLIKISHAMGFSTRYAHLSKILVKPGEYVRQGQVIAHSGNTGDSTAPHLHYEVRFVGQSINPKPFMDWDLTNYDKLMETARQLPWASFQKELIHLTERPKQLLSRQVPISKESLN